MTPTQVALIRDSFAAITDAGAAATQFYSGLFALNPKLRRLFPDDMTAQGLKLINMIAVAVAHADRLDEVAPVVAMMGRRHHDYGVQASDYETVKQALVQMLAKTLGAKFTPETAAAWSALYEVLANVMQAGAVRDDVKA